MNAPLKIFFWGAGQMMGFIVMFCLGAMANSPLIGGFFGALLALAIGKASSKNHRAFWRHCLYWFVPGRLGMQWLPDSSMRQFLR